LHVLQRHLHPFIGLFLVQEHPQEAHIYLPFLFFNALKSAPVIFPLGLAAPAIFFCFGERFLPLPNPGSPFFLPHPHTAHITSYLS
jgi:hypothetical protein